MSENSALAELMELYMEGELSDSQARELLNALRESPEAAAVVRNELAMDYHLLEACHPEAYHDSLRRAVEEQLRAVSDADAFVTSALRRIRKSTEGAATTPKRKGRGRARGIRWVAPPLAATAALVVGLLYFGLIGPRPPGGVEGTAGRIAGTGVEIRKAGTGAWRAIVAEEAVTSGDAVRTGDACEFVLVYDDGTEVLLRENGELALLPENMEHRSSESSRTLPKRLRLVRGAVATTVARQPADAPFALGTEHASFTVRGTRFFLMIADTAEPFTRLDVMEGNVDAEVAGGPPRHRSGAASKWQVASGRAICVGDGIEPKVVTSDGREFSPEYGGCFFREYAQLYGTRGYALDALEGEDGRELARVTAERVAETARAHETAHVEDTTKNGRRMTAIRNDGDKAIAVTVPLPMPPGDACVIACDAQFVPLRKTHGMRFVLGREGYARLDPEPRPPATPYRKGTVMDVRGVEPFPYRTEFLHVGRTPDGRRVWERREVAADAPVDQRVWELLDEGADYPFGFRIPPGGAMVMSDIRVLERTVNRPQ